MAPRAEYAGNCSRQAGKALAARMDAQTFRDWEGVIVALKGESPCGYCTISREDCLSTVSYTPFIGYVLMGEAHRGHRSVSG